MARPFCPLIIDIVYKHNRGFPGLVRSRPQAPRASPRSAHSARPTRPGEFQNKRDQKNRPWRLRVLETSCDTKTRIIRAKNASNAARARFVDKADKPYTKDRRQPTHQQGRRNGSLRSNVRRSRSPLSPRSPPPARSFAVALVKQSRTCQFNCKSPLRPTCVAAPSLPHAWDETRRARVTRDLGASIGLRNSRCDVRIDVMILQSHGVVVTIVSSDSRRVRHGMVSFQDEGSC